MTSKTTGLLVGLILGLAAAAGGFLGFLLTAVLGVLGWAVGAFLDGSLDLSRINRYVEQQSNRRSPRR